jgi:hypothetical protein
MVKLGSSAGVGAGVDLKEKEEVKAATNIVLFLPPRLYS